MRIKTRPQLKVSVEYASRSSVLFRLDSRMEQPASRVTPKCNLDPPATIPNSAVNLYNSKTANKYLSGFIAAFDG
jgi:hypothetical protein